MNIIRSDFNHEATEEMRDGAAAATACCRNCGSPLRETFVDLGMSPLVQSFVPASKLDEVEYFYPLHTLVCGECKLIQLRDYVAPDHIFTEYAYFSSYSPPTPSSAYGNYDGDNGGHDDSDGDDCNF